MLWIVPISFLILFELVADIIAKEYSLKGGWVLWTGAILGYILANIFWLSAMKEGVELARGAVIFSVSSAIIAVLIGIFIFHEETSRLQIVGFALGVVSLLLIFWE